MLNFTQDENFIKPEINFSIFDIQNSILAQEELTYDLSLNYKVHLDELMLFSSKKALLHSFARYVFSFLDIKNIVIYSPLETIYEEIFSLYEFNILKINIYENLYKDIPSKSLVIFSNPNLIDGKYYHLEELLFSWSKKDAFVLFDESFLDYSTNASATSYLNINKNIFILKSLNKFYSSSIVKVSTLISSKNHQEKIKIFEADDNISFFDIFYTKKLLKEENFKLMSKALNAKNKFILEQILGNKKIFDYFLPSDTNFILVKVLDSKLEEFNIFLHKNSILVKECSSYDFLDKTYFRFVVKSKDELKTLSLLLKYFNT